LSYEDRDKIRKERDKKGEQGGSKQSISELTTKQLTTALIRSLQKINESEDREERSAKAVEPSGQRLWRKGRGKGTKEVRVNCGDVNVQLRSNIPYIRLQTSEPKYKLHCIYYKSYY
jgi:hypothetical protein